MDLNSLQVIVIKDTYEIFDEMTEVQDLLARVWALKLLGYKKFYKDPSVCPNDKLDFYSNHIIITRKDDLNRPLAAIKNITYDICKMAKSNLPTLEHLFGKNIDPKHYLHAYALNEWIEKNKDSGVGYSNGFSMDPNLPKNMRRFLLEFISYSFYSFYLENKIPNIVHGVNTLSKIDKSFESIGFKDIVVNDVLKIPTFQMKSLLDLDVRIMVSENYGIDPSSLNHHENHEKLWDNRIEYTKEILSEKAKAA